MVNTRNSGSHTDPNFSSDLNPDTLSQQLLTIASHLQALDTLAADVAAFKAERIERPKDRGRTRKYEGGAFLGTHMSDDDAEYQGRYQNFARPPIMKMEFPKFKGGDPRGWILKAEKYFCYYHTPNEQKVKVASMYLEGDALDLFAWITEFQNPDEHFCGVKQTGTVQEYRQEFAKRASRVHNWPEHCLLGVFLNGLKVDLKADVRIHKPRTVYKAVSFTLEFEAKLGATRSQKGSNAFFTKSSLQAASSTPARLLTPSSRTSFSPTQTLVQSGTWDAKRQSRRDNGLCFCYNEKFSSGHKCKQSNFLLLEITKGEEQDEGQDNDLQQEVEATEISFHAILGQTMVTTMKLLATLSKKQVIILVDSGSTHNFISTSLVKELGLKVELVPRFFPFPMRGADVVLGIQWLASLNTIQANWNKMFMIFYLNRKQYKLQGIPSTTHIGVSLHSYSKLVEAREFFEGWKPLSPLQLAVEEVMSE
ncbi:retrotransposon gag domain, retroviral aspartyl protease [Tanacetum coccineum]